MATLDELTTPLTRDEIEQAIYDAIEARGVATSSWKPGAVARTIIAGAALVLSAFSQLQQSIAQSGFLELAAGDWLTIVAREVYGVERNTGSFAAGTLTLDNTAGGVFAPAIGDVIALNTTTGKTYRNTEAFTLAAFEVGKAVAFQAVELGADSTASPGDIDALETVLLGVTVTNAAALVGQDAETDAELRARALAKTATLSPNGAADAYRFVALSATTDDGVSAGVTRTNTVADGAGNVTLYVADGSGTLTGSIGDTTTPLGAVDEAIQTQVVPLAVTATTTPATPFVQPLTYTVFANATIGLTAAELEAQINLALTNYLATLPIGGLTKVFGTPGELYTDALQVVIGEAVGDALIDLFLATPGSDQALSADEATVAGAITATINLVAQ